MHLALALALVLVPNLDDDDRDGSVDWLQPGAVDRDDDVVLLEGLPPGTVLQVTGDAWAIRVRSAGEHVAGGDLPPWPVPADAAPLVLDVGAFGVRAELRFTDRAGRLVLAREVVGAPLVLPHPLMPVATVQVARLDPALDEADNTSFIRALSRHSPVPVEVRDTWSEGGRWLQDEYELGVAVGDWSRLEVVLRHWAWGAEGYVPWQDLLLGPGRAVVGAEWPREVDSDGFGNLEVTPPLDGFPLGRILYGVGADGPPGSGFLDLLEAQGAQAPTPIDTSWLCVGHVDELLSFVPDPTAPRGFRALVPDVTAGAELVPSLDEETAALNKRIAEVHLIALRAELEAIGIHAEEIIGLPVLYGTRPAWWDGECGAVPLWPNPVNLLAAHDGERAVAFVADPSFRLPGVSVREDPVARRVAALLPRSLQVVWVDTWESYHRYGGEVHCATNVRRVWRPPPADVPEPVE